MKTHEPHITVRDLTMAYGSYVLQRNLSFTVNRGDVFIIMGGSGCGKSTLMRHLIGLKEPASGQVLYGAMDFWESEPDERDRMMRRLGVMYQSGALWSSLTLAENIALPLELYTKLKPAQIREIASLKLSLVGLAGFEDYYPSEISGGMKKRVGIARAMALDPEILFFDEPSAGLDPVSARLLDDLVLELKDSLGTTVVVVTHELSSIFAIGNNSVFLDVSKPTMTATGNPTSSWPKPVFELAPVFNPWCSNLHPIGCAEMAKQANRMMIGGFVVLAVIIMAASLVVFGSGKFFKKTNKYLLYFDESIKGLSVGAPVLFQGVQVGSVTSITLQADLEKMKTQIPVFIEIEPDR